MGSKSTKTTGTTKAADEDFYPAYEGSVEDAEAARLWREGATSAPAGSSLNRVLMEMNDQNLQNYYNNLTRLNLLK